MAFQDFRKFTGPLGSSTPENPFTAPSTPPPQQTPNLLANKSPVAAVQQPPQRSPPPPKRPDPSLGRQGYLLKHDGNNMGAYSTRLQWIRPAAAINAYDTETNLTNFNVPKRTMTPPLTSHHDFLNNSHSATANIGRPDVSPVGLAGQRSPVNAANLAPPQRFQPVNYSDIYDTGTRTPSKLPGFAAAKWARSPPLSPNRSLGNSPIKLDNESQRKSPVNTANSPPYQRYQPVEYSGIYDAGIHSSPGPANPTVPKRARSPPSPSSNGSLNASSSQLDSEREMQAKAKRLARFNVELSQPVESLQDAVRHKALGTTSSQIPVDRKITDNPADEAHDFMRGGTLSDSEGMGSTVAVIGLCPDMCPELEREERERKGDLDKHERVDGDRNQTSKFLAVKKYNRTAERRTDLIRPMPVLQKTIDYLLQLLDRSYTDNFLGIYNFLWDRMRAIRMDLRMQHLFNREAIVMLEQMIRLHIIAMHELCEYNKGEGFSEGFDAHLNIEQMNKASVELFQMYDNHMNKGDSVETEKEFRCYYALLKLDIHPGYKVEPSELSQDLAKMTPEIRRSQELLFARDVARACRTGNYIAFFRLARKASFLQACLMHAHFAKVRKQALAFLHSGLPINQGIPVSHIVQWLAMEGEDIDSLLEYYGFGVKKYEEKYMVKEGTFINIDTDFPTKCSRLVHLKKSRRIIHDACTGQPLSELSPENEVAADVIDQKTDILNRGARVKIVDEEMSDDKVDSVHSAFTSSQQLVEEPLTFISSKVHKDEAREGSLSESRHVSLVNSMYKPEQKVDNRQVFELDEDVFVDETALQVTEGNTTQAGVSGHSNPSQIESINPVVIVSRSLDHEPLSLKPNQDEVANEKLKLILRKWKQWSSMRREIREQKEFLANAALSSLSLGPPIRKNKGLPRCVTGELNINSVATERHARHEKSWSKLNVSELVAAVLGARNPSARCICWKLVVFVQPSGAWSQYDYLASRWLLAKLRGKEIDDGLMVSSPEFSIWKKWINHRINGTEACCLSVIREGVFDNKQSVSEGIIAGTSCILFLVSESIPWEIQRVRVHNLCMSIPSGSSLPLLVVSTDSCKEGSDPSDIIINRLGLHGTDRTRISTFSVLFLYDEFSLGQSNGFFGDDQLREGLRWLANNSPPQLLVHTLKTRELVLSYLWNSVDVLHNLKISEVDPRHCISAFNEALDRLVEEIMNAASMNPNHWPCPEICLIDKSTERILAEKCLPSVGWSSSARIEPRIRAVKECKLPSFPSNLPWMNHGCSTQSEIHYQKLAIEECLTSYLTQSSLLLNPDLAAREASIMLQKGAVLELHGSSYHIVPRWLVIFQRIYNWQLVKLTLGENSVAYILEQSDGTFIFDQPYRTEIARPLNVNKSPKNLNNFSPDGHQSMHSAQTELSLDEMIEVCCSVPVPLQQLPSVSSPVNPASVCVPEARHATDVHNGFETAGTDPKYILSSSSEVSISPSVEVNKGKTISSVADKKSDKLSLLLKQCNQLQDMIDEKLNIYF